MTHHRKSNLKLTYLLLSIIAFNLLVYGSIAFIEIELNPFNWNEGLRGTLVIIFFISIILSLPVNKLIRRQLRHE